jgi:hypothetical protein
MNKPDIPSKDCPWRLKAGSMLGSQLTDRPFQLEQRRASMKQSYDSFAAPTALGLPTYAEESLL